MEKINRDNFNRMLNDIQPPNRGQEFSIVGNQKLLDSIILENDKRVKQKIINNTNGRDNYFKKIDNSDYWDKHWADIIKQVRYISKKLLMKKVQVDIKPSAAQGRLNRLIKNKIISKPRAGFYTDYGYKSNSHDRHKLWIASLMLSIIYDKGVELYPDFLIDAVPKPNYHKYHFNLFGCEKRLTPDLVIVKDNKVYAYEVEISNKSYKNTGSSLTQYDKLKEKIEGYADNLKSKNNTQRMFDCVVYLTDQKFIYNRLLKLKNEFQLKNMIIEMKSDYIMDI